MKLKTFDIEMYAMTVCVVFDDKWRDIIKEECKKITGEDLYNPKCDNDGAAAFFFPANNIYLCFDADVEIRVICHECFHALTYVMRACGIDFDIDNHEALAYLLEYITHNAITLYAKHTAPKKRKKR